MLTNMLFQVSPPSSSSSSRLRALVVFIPILIGSVAATAVVIRGSSISILCGIVLLELAAAGVVFPGIAHPVFPPRFVVAIASDGIPWTGRRAWAAKTPMAGCWIIFRGLRKDEAVVTRTWSGGVGVRVVFATEFQLRPDLREEPRERPLREKSPPNVEPWES